MLQSVERHVHVEKVMGTAVTIDVRGGEPPHDAIADVVRRLHDVDAAFSPYRETSAVRRLDRGELRLADASPDLQWVVERCTALHRETDGYFDARAFGRFDPSALVKGWAVQRAADLLCTAGARDFCLTAGGDIAVRGEAAPHVPWRIGIQHPLDHHAIATVVELRDVAIATSGAYERGAHVRDPHLRRAPDGVLSVTVTGADLGTADAYATAAFAMGRRGPAWTLALRGYEAMTILADETVLMTPGFPAVEA